MIENTIWHTILFDSYDRWNRDKGGSCGTLLTDLSKVFDCIVHDFLISKLQTYGFIHEVLNVMQNYISDKIHRKRKIIIIAAHFSIY